jgi:multiple sugar transport system substrate-binding protein
MRGLAFILTAALVAACGSAPPSKPAAVPVTITLLEHQATRAKVLESLLPSFEAETAADGHPIRVQLTRDIGTDDAFEADLARRYAAGQAPDVTSYPTAAVAAFAEQGYLLDVASRVKAWSDWGAHFYPILRERAVSADGHMYGVPRGATVIQLFYRKDVLDANGVSTAQPASWADLLDRMRLLRDRMQRPPLLIPGGTSWGTAGSDEGFVNLVLGTASRLYDTTTGRWVVRSRGLTDVFRYYELLTKDGLLPVAALLAPTPWEPTKYQTFPDGDLAVTTQGTWGWTYDWGPTGQHPIPGLTQRVATWAFPTEDGSSPFVWAAESWRWTISASSAHPDEAWTFIKWISQGAPLAADLVTVGNLSPRDDIADVPPYRDQPELTAEEKLIQLGRSLRPYDGIEHIRTAAASATQGILEGRLTGDEAAAEFARLATATLGAARVEDAAGSGPSSSP